MIEPNRPQEQKTKRRWKTGMMENGDRFPVIPSSIIPIFQNSSVPITRRAREHTQFRPEPAQPLESEGLYYCDGPFEASHTLLGRQPAKPACGLNPGAERVMATLISHHLIVRKRSADLAVQSNA